MAIGDDFSVAVNGDIRHVSGTTHYTVLELHRWVQNLADDQSAVGNDLIDITSPTPSSRSTDQIIQLLSTYNIDDTAAEFLYGGSIKQGADETEVLYAGLRVLGAVNNANTQVELVQDQALYDTPTPFWGDQSAGGYNGDTVSGILFRVLVKCREFGADVDGKRIRVQARHWGDTYDFFNVTLGEGEAVGAISTTPDAQNDTLQATVTAYTHIVNSGGTAAAPTGGYQTIDLNNGNGPEPYYSKWTFGADTSGDGLKGMWEYIKDLTGNGTARTVDGIAGELFLGITHSIPYDTEAGGPFTERETVVWGTDITYDTLAGGTFSAGDYVVFDRAGAYLVGGKVVYDNGSTNMIVALEDPTVSLADGDVITEASTGTVTAAINVTILNNSANGGEGVLLALNDEGTTGDLWIQVISGAAPVENLPIRGITSTATCAADAGIVARTVPKIFLGSYTGSLIGAYGIGVDEGDVGASDSLQDLLGVTQVPPNNVTFTVLGVVVGEDYILLGPKATGFDFEFDQLTLTTTLNGGTETSVVVDEAIPADTPATGWLRITLDDGRVRYQPYTAWAASTFTIASADYTDPDDATAGNAVMIAYLDLLATATSEAFTGIYSAPRDLFLRVRDGGGTPIKTFETQATLGAAGGAAVVSRISDA